VGLELETGVAPLIARQVVECPELPELGAAREQTGLTVCEVVSLQGSICIGVEVGFLDEK
jgi:hypothetical protein